MEAHTAADVQMMKSIESALLSDRVVGIVGPGGGDGKTVAWKKWAQVNGYSWIQLVDFGKGYPDVDGTVSESGKPVMPYWQYQILTEPKPLLFVKYFDTIPAEAQDTLVKIATTRKLPNGLDLPKDTLVILSSSSDPYYSKATTDHPEVKWFQWQSSQDGWLDHMAGKPTYIDLIRPY